MRGVFGPSGISVVRPLSPSPLKRQFSRSSTPGLSRQLLRATDGLLRRREKNRLEEIHLIKVVESRGLIWVGYPCREWL